MIKNAVIAAVAGGLSLLSVGASAAPAATPIPLAAPAQVHEAGYYYPGYPPPPGYWRRHHAWRRWHRPPPYYGWNHRRPYYHRPYYGYR